MANDPSFPWNMTEKEQQEFEARTNKAMEETEHLRRIADAYVREYEHGRATMEEVAERCGIHRKTLYNWINYNLLFYELVLEARIRAGNSIADLKYTNLRTQIQKYIEIYRENPSIETCIMVLPQIAKLCNLYGQKTYEQTQMEKPRCAKERLRQMLLGKLENICAHDPAELEKAAPPPEACLGKRKLQAHDLVEQQAMGDLQRRRVVQQFNDLPFKLSEQEQQEYDTCTRKRVERLERRRNIAETYVREREHGERPLAEVAKRCGIHRNTLCNWVYNDGEFAELLTEARIKVGGSVSDLPYTSRRSQVQEYEKMIKSKDFTLKMEMKILHEIAKLCRLYDQKPSEQLQMEKVEERNRERQRQQLYALIRKVYTPDPAEFNKHGSSGSATNPN